MPADKSPSNEFFSLAPDGTRSDAELHADLLDSPQGKLEQNASLKDTIERLRADGVSEDVLQQLYGPFEG